MGAGLMTGLAAGSSGGSTTPVWATVVLAIVGSAVVANIVAGFLTKLRETAAARRDRYAAATQLLVARLEYPYRIRRRVSDDPSVLSDLASRGHDLQERLAEARAWVTSESAALGTLYAETLVVIDRAAGVSCQEAWDAAPAATAAAMNVGDFGPRGHQDDIDRFQCAIRYRFGWRRLLPGWFISRRIMDDHCAVTDVTAATESTGPAPVSSTSPRR